MRHLWVEDGQHLRSQLDDRDVKTAMPQGFRDLQPDESGADHHRPSSSGNQQGLERVNIRDRTQHSHLGEVGARDRRHDRRCPCGKHEGVVILDIHAPGRQVANGYCMACDVDGDHLVQYPDVERQARR